MHSMVLTSELTLLRAYLLPVQRHIWNRKQAGVSEIEIDIAISILDQYLPFCDHCEAPHAHNCAGEDECRGN